MNKDEIKFDLITNHQKRQKLFSILGAVVLLLASVSFYSTTINKTTHNDLASFYWHKFYCNLVDLHIFSINYDFRGKEDKVYEDALTNGFTWKEISDIRERARLQYLEDHPSRE